LITRPNGGYSDTQISERRCTRKGNEKYLRDLSDGLTGSDLHERITIKWLLNENNMRMWPQLTWFRIR
jgi:hypothetical protein